MYKLKDIITSGGSNAKINKSIDRYILSKKEKKDIIKNIKNIKNNSQNNNSSTLSKGKKILSEYYYFNLGLISNNSEYYNKFRTVMATFGFSLGSLEESLEKMPIIESVIENNPIYKDATELNNIIVKYKVDDAYRYIYDSLPSNDINDPTNVYIAIRKYCPIYDIVGSGIGLYKYNLTNFIDCFNAYINAQTNAFGLSEEEINNYKQTINDMIKDCSITEEKFWAEAKIINDINDINETL